MKTFFIKNTTNTVKKKKKDPDLDKIFEDLEITKNYIYKIEWPPEN